MARYIGTLTSDARGKVGGVVFSRSRVGTTIGSRAVQKNSPSPMQSSRRIIMAAALQAWRNLTDANQVSWGQVAVAQTWKNSLGQTYSPTGLQLWQQAYVNASYVGAVPPGTCAGSPGAISVVIGATLNTDLSVYDVYGLFTGGFLAYGTWAVPSSRNYVKTLATKFINWDASVGYCEWRSHYQAAFGVYPVAGSWYGVIVQPYDVTYFYSGTRFFSRLQYL
jgi:hypothetical protein